MRRLALSIALPLALLVLLGAILIGRSWWPTTQPTREDRPGAAMEPVGPGGAYLRGAHWFGDGWAVNFWNTRLRDRAARDFAMLRADGFNTVVLVVPWPGFAPSPREGGVDTERRQRLAALVDLAGDAGLNVVLRVGYAWDAAVERSGQWLMRLWTEDDVRRAWIRHIAALWKVAEDRPHVRFAFISWEDLWAVEGLGEGTPEQRLEAAQSTGYQDWLRRWSTLETVSARYGRPFQRWEEVPIPQRMEPAFGLFFDFIDHAWIERFFKPAQAVFPTLSMEVRIDSDPVWNAPGELAYWHSHELAWDLPGAPWTTVYWAPAMGGENRGEILTPETAAERLAYQMNRLRDVTGNRPIFIDQFLVEDFTPGFEMNGRLERDRVDEFLRLAAPVLARLTHGYALWTWRDYRHDAVVSPDFALAGGGWSEAPTDRDEDPAFDLEAGDRLRRTFGINEFHAPGGPERAELCVRGTADGAPSPDLAVTSDREARRFQIDLTGGEEQCVTLAVGPSTAVNLEALRDLELHGVHFSGFLQPTGIRDLSGARKPVAEGWVRLNESLDRAQPAPFDAFDDGWIGKTLTREFRIPLAGAPWALSLRTHLPPDWPVQPTLTVEMNGRPVGTVPCTADGDHRLRIENPPPARGKVKAALTAARTWRPDGDERRLGCIVSNLELEAAD